MTRIRLLLACAAMTVASSQFLWAVEPTIRNVNVRGLTIDGATTLIVDGDDLGEAPKLFLPFPAKLELHPKSTAKQATFTVTLAGDVIPGYYQMRLANEHGVSLPFGIAVDRLPQRPLTAAVEPTPVALHGSVTGGNSVEAKFTGKAGQKIVVDVEAVRLGSKLRPVIHLIGAKRLQIAWAWPSGARGGDCRLEATLPADGEYVVALHDVEYAAAAPTHFRLLIGTLPSVDRVFPPALTQGTSRGIDYFGSGAWHADIVAPASAGILPLPWPKDMAGAGPRPFVVVSPHPELEEIVADTGKGQDLPAGSVGVSGRLSKPYEVDVYRIPTVPGTKLRLEAFAERLGSPIDIALIVRNEKGIQLLRIEDGAGTLDPAAEYVVPENTKQLLIDVVDVQGRGHANAIYRLRIDPQTKSGEEDFRLMTSASRLSLPGGSRGVVPIFVERLGYRGPITLAAKLPAGYRLDGAQIPAEADGALVTVHRDASPALEPALLTWTGRAVSGAERTVKIQGLPMESLQPWLANEFAIAPVTAKAPEFQIDWPGLAADALLRPGKKLDLPVKVRHADEKATVRLSLLTSQNPPLINKQPDATRQLKAEKAIELGPKISEGTVTLVVPAALTGMTFDFAILGELLGADKKTVLAAATTPVRRLELRSPLVVKLDGPARREVTLGPKSEPLPLAGTIERRDDFKGDVLVTLTGLPAGAKAETTVKAAETAFHLKVALPAKLSAGELSGLTLFATAAIDPQQPAVRVRSRDVPLTLNVKTAP
jgi:hypothetical protein